MNDNQIIYLNKIGKNVKVLNLKTPSIESVEYAKIKGFNAIHLDAEHGSFNVVSIENLCRLAIGMGLTVTARVQKISNQNINLFLDRGVQGIVGPHVETYSEGLLLAESCRYPPIGNRSWGGGRGTEFNDDQKLSDYGGKLKYAEWTNSNMLVIAQIESVPGWDNLEEILSVEGLSGITGGPNDLAASMGIPGEPDNPKRKELTSNIESMARSKNKIVQDDIMNTLAIQELMIEGGRKFIK